MNEEEKKVIKMLDKFTTEHKFYNTKELKKYAKRENELVYDDIILNLIEKLQKENEKLNNICRNLDKEAQGYLEELVGDDTLSTRTMKQLQKENEELKEINEQLSENKLLQDIEIKKNFIPIQKVKDKIETLEKIQKEFPNNERLEVKIIAYKELLGKE